ncbi:MAG: branched-chain amino acid ABC transporter permease [Dehalococcoidia bacterium]
MISNWKAIIAILVFLGIAIALPELTNPYYDHLLVLCLIYIIVGIAFNLYLGFLGELTMAHTAFFGLGGYASGLIAVKAGWPTGVGLLVDISICVVAALVLGLTALRLKGAYFVIITVAFLGIVAQLSTTLHDLTGSTSGLRGIPSPSFGFIDFDSTQRFYYLALGFLIVILILVYCLINSRVGRGFIAIRDNEPLANSLGINPFKYKMIGFVASAVICGTAGWLYAHYIHIMDPAIFGMGLLFDTIFIVILGGTGTLVGPIVGALVVVFGPELITEHIYKVDEAWRTAALALFMLGVIVLMPQGVWGFFKMRWMQYKHQDTGQSSPLGKASDFLRTFLGIGKGSGPKKDSA